MLPEQQQRIMGYFIEEAKDHLNTIEQGLLNLQATIEDPEMANEVFRAAHSVKGGAAMLGIESMQRASHRLEDYFKILKESPVRVDRALETMCLQVFDALQELLEQLQGPFGLTEDKAQEIMTNVEPVFGQLDAHLNSLVQENAAAPAAAAVQPAVRQPSVVANHAEQSALKLVFKSDVPSHLREMLSLFKQNDSPATRQQLQEVCDSLNGVGEQFDLASWCDLAKTAKAAIACTDNTYRALAPVVIKDLKQGQDLILSGRAAEVSVSETLQQMLPEDSLLLDESAALEDLLDDDEVAVDADLGDLFEDAAEPVDSLDLGIDNADSADFLAADDSSLNGDLAGLDDAADLTTDDLIAAGATEPPLHPTTTHNGPEVGTAELNSLADLFEGDMEALDTTWQEEVAEDILLENPDALDVDISNDFSDLLTEGAADEDQQMLSATDDLGELFGEDTSDLEAPDAVTHAGEPEADMSDLLDMFDGESAASESAAPEAEADLTLLETAAPSSKTPVGMSEGLDELDDFFNEFEGDAAVGLPPAASASDPVATQDFDDVFAMAEASAADSLPDSTTAEGEPEALFSDEPAVDGSLEPETTRLSELDADLESDLWSDDVNLSDSNFEDAAVASLTFEPEEISDPWVAETQAASGIDLDLEADTSNEMLDSLLPEDMADEEASLDLTADLFTAAAETENLELETPDWPFSAESTPLESADEAAELNFDLDSFDTPEPELSAAGETSLESFEDLLFEEVSDPAESLSPDTAGSDSDLTFELDNVETLDTSDLAAVDEFSLDFDDIGKSTEPSADESTADFSFADTSEGLNGAEADDSSLLELEATEEDFSSIFDEEEADNTEIQVGDSDEDFSGLFDQPESSQAIDETSFEELSETAAAGIDDFSELAVADEEQTDEELDGLFANSLSSEASEDFLTLEEDDLELAAIASAEPIATAAAASEEINTEAFDSLFAEADEAATDDLEADFDLDTTNLEDDFNLDEISSEDSSTDSADSLEALLADSSDELAEWPNPEETASEFDSLLDDSLETLEDNATDPEGAAFADLNLEDLDESESTATDLDGLLDEPFDLEAEEVSPAEPSAAEALEDDLWDSPEGDAEFSESIDAADADLSLFSEAEDSGDFADLFAADTDETTTAVEDELLVESFDVATDEADVIDPDFSLEMLDDELTDADDEANATAASLDDLDFSADEDPVEPSEVNATFEINDDELTAFETQFAQNQVEPEASVDDLDLLLASDQAVTELDENSGADDELNFLDGDFDAADLATSISLTAATDADLGMAGEVAAEPLETQLEGVENEADEADFAELDSLLEEPAAAIADATEVGDDFSDLEALLDDSTAEDQPDTTANVPLAEHSEADTDFADLEALLDEESEIADNSTFAAAEITDSGSDFEENGNEFEDLERLLEEADQTLGGGGSTASLRSAPQRSRRPARRGSSILGEQTMRVSVKHLDNLSNLVGELVVNRNTLEQDQERLRQFLDNLMFQVQQLNDVGQRMRDLYERSLLESSLISSRQSYQIAGSRRPEEKASHSTGATFDALEMDRFTGFHTLSQEMIELIVRVRESASDIGYTIESADQVTRQFRQVTTQLQEGLNKARMVPFAQTADRLPRAVRDISVKCGKEARLIVEGRDTLIDKMILEQLYDPMTHLVNNAITHGIEPPEARGAQGKPREGQITVRAFYQGNQTVIYVADDGGGIDAELVKEKAVQKGLITSVEARNISIHDVYELLFHPGFSTRDQADDFAGRGVGMDVVRTYLAQIRGNITIDSEIGKGTSFTIRLPLTLSISKALTCISNQARIAFPMDGVEDMIDVPKERIQENDQGQTCILWRDTLLPFQPLSDLLQFNRTLGRGRIYGGNQDDEVISIVILRSASTNIALQVDQVIGEQEIVIKQLEGPVPKPMGIAGATVLGDGRVMPIADVLELIDLSMGRVRREPNTSLWGQLEEARADVPVEPIKTEPTVLIVDDSITVRELLSMSFNKVGYRVEQARDGQEAWEKLRSGLPCDLVFCDIEMPRMDGLELLSRMQKDPSLSEIPIAMLTSRGADRHRQMAVDLGASGYFTKPYLEEVLLDAAQRMLNGEILASGKTESASS